MKKVLVTGGAGFIGSHCVDRLLSEGYEVVVLDLKTIDEAVNLSHVMDKIDYRVGDIRRLGDVTDAIKGCKKVIHLAAEVSVQKSFHDIKGTHKTNVIGTNNVFNAAHRGGVQRTVYASSAAVYGDTAVIPTPETAIGTPLSPYGAHKAKNEEDAAAWVREHDLSMVGLRFFNVYGSRQDPSSPYSGVISIFSKLMQEGKAPTIYGDGSQTRDFIHVSDVVNACVSALNVRRTFQPIYNVATGRPVSLIELVQELNEVLETDHMPVFAEARRGDITDSCAVNGHLAEVIDITKLQSIKAGLQETVGQKSRSL